MGISEATTVDYAFSSPGRVKSKVAWYGWAFYIAAYKCMAPIQTINFRGTRNGDYSVTGP